MKQWYKKIKRRLQSLVKIFNRKRVGRLYLHVPQVSFGHGTALIRYVYFSM